MKREKVLQRLRFTVPEKKRKRVIVHTDICNEADDPFAIMHHLLTPSEEVEGIIAGHNEWVMGVMMPQIAKQHTYFATVICIDCTRRVEDNNTMFRGQPAT